MSAPDPAAVEARTLDEISAMVGDDLRYWLGNPFMDQSLLMEKVCWWVNRALAAARTERAPEVEALIESEIAEAVEANVRAETADVRCLDCGLRYEERQEYGCGESGRGHSFDDGDIADAEKSAREDTVEYVTLRVADLRAALAAPEPQQAEADRAGGERTTACPWCFHGDPHPSFSDCAGATQPADDASEGLSETIRVKVTVDTDELREWAGKHADAGHHGVAHVLYAAANDGEGLTEQTIREAEQRGREDNADHAMCYVHGSEALAAREREVAATTLREAADRWAEHEFVEVEWLRSQADAHELGWRTP